MKSKLIKVFLIALVIGVNFYVFKAELFESWASLKGKNLISSVALGKNWGSIERLRTDAVEISGWSERDKLNLSLEPQMTGSVIYEFTKPIEASKTILQLTFFHPVNGSNKASVSTDKVKWQIIAENKQLALLPMDISQYLDDSQQFWVKLEATNQNLLISSGPPAVILDELYLMFYAREIKFPPIMLMLTTIFFPLLLVFRPKFNTALKISLFILVMAIALHLSLKNLYDNRYHSLDNDMICLTQEVPRFLSLDWKKALLGNYCGNKESLNMLIILAFWKIFGFGSEIGIRVSSLFFHLMTAVAVFFYGIKIKSFTTGLVATLFVGIHPYLIQLSARGLRDSAFTFITLVFVYLLFESNLSKIGNKIWLIIISAGAIYLRLHSVVQYFGIILVLLASKRDWWKTGLLAALTLFLVAWPLIVYNLKTYQAWNPSEKKYLRWMTNVEFAGQAGFPSKESVAFNPFQGPEISTTTYWFKLHAVPNLVTLTIKGTMEVFIYLYFVNSYLGVLLFIAGAGMMLENKWLWYIPFLVFFLEIPHFTLAAKHLIEQRSLTHSLPFIGLTLGYIIDRLWLKLKHF